MGTASEMTRRRGDSNARALHLSSIVVGWVVSIVALSWSACSPLTSVRRTALVPTVAPVARTGAPLSKGAIRVMAEATGVDTAKWDEFDLYTTVGSAGVYVPDVEAGASGYVGVSDHVELGVRMLYTNDAWSTPNTAGVLPFPASQNPRLFLGGIGIRYNAPFQGDAGSGAVSLIGELNGVSIPEATYVYVPCDEGCSDVLGHYELYGTTSEPFLLPDMTLQVGYYLGDHVFLHGFTGVTFGIRNVGFDNDEGNIDNSTLEPFVVTYFGLGAEFHVGSFVSGVHAYVPMENQSDIEFGGLMAVSAGVQFD